ncbi:helix-turn-helix transcriptional regulator [bacterium]|nr:helix-turn-helix transcriptional regulator [bacterium]
MNNKQALGKRIKELRKNCGLTQEKLAELIDIETGSLSAIESGRHFPSLPTLEKIAENLNTELVQLFEFKSLISVDEMKKKIVDNIDKLDNNQIKFIYKFFEHIKS